MRSISLYVHVPFCRRRCSYCTFYHVPHIADFEALFVDALLTEFEAAVREIDSAFRFPTVFFGGGTPSVLNPESLDRIFNAMRPYLKHGAEITFETNPEDVTPALLNELKARGVNRLSLGVQSMNVTGLRRLGRSTPKVNDRAMGLAVSHFDNVSFDLLLGIPDAPPEALERTLECVLEYRPQHFSVYCLEPGGVMQRDVEGFFDAVDPERSADEYLHVCAVLREEGYNHYEVSNFAMPGHESDHNRVYWRGADYIGIGPGAHSFLDGERFGNVPSIEQYVAGSRETRGVTRRHEGRGEEERLLEGAMLGLRTSAGLSLERLSCERSVVDDLVIRRLARLEADRLVLTDRGFLLLDEILLRITRAA